MRSSNLLFLLLLVLAALIWLFALQPEPGRVPHTLPAKLQATAPSPPSPVITVRLSSRRSLLATMHRTYDDRLYDFVCVERWTGTVALTVRPILSRSPERSEGSSEGKVK